MIQLICQDLSLGYAGRVVCEGIDFSLSQGDYLCITGENGTGKSTLIKTLLGLQPPLRGRVRLTGGLKRREIGYLPQQGPLRCAFPASVEEVTLSGCLNRCGLRPFYTHAERMLAHAWLERLGLSGLHGRCYRELSGGQRQRVLLARALCASRSLLMLDEPVSGLDPEASAEMYAALRRLNREDRLTIVMVSHDVAAAVREAGRILHLGRRPLFLGAAADYPASAAGMTFLAAKGGEQV